MRIAILGAGFAGLSAAHYLSKQHHSVKIFEKRDKAGGLAAGFKDDDWDWYLDYAYHHIFSSDFDFINLANDIKFGEIQFYNPVTASLFYNKGNYKKYPLDTPLDLLKFPLLSLNERFRTGAILGLLKYGPLLHIYEKNTVDGFLTTAMGKKAWNTLFGDIFRKKFGKYAENILTAFFWARIKSRTKQLGYPIGGFQAFIDNIEQYFSKSDVTLQFNTDIKMVIFDDKKFSVYYNDSKKEEFDVVISTLPTPVLVQVAGEMFPDDYVRRLRKVKYLAAANFIIQTDRPLIKDYYWLNISTDKIPFMVFVQHTNMIDKKYYGGKHLAYIGNYFDISSSPLASFNKKNAYDYFLPYLDKIKDENNKIDIKKSYWFSTPYAQPIYDKEFVQSKPDFRTPVKNFYVANLDMTYPYDRGTNYAVKLGRQVAELIN